VIAEDRVVVLPVVFVGGRYDVFCHARKPQAIPKSAPVRPFHAPECEESSPLDEAEMGPHLVRDVGFQPRLERVALLTGQNGVHDSTCVPTP